MLLCLYPALWKQARCVEDDRRRTFRIWMLCAPSKARQESSGNDLVVGAYGGARFPNSSTKVEAVQFVFGFGRPNPYGKSPNVVNPIRQAAIYPRLSDTRSMRATYP